MADVTYPKTFQDGPGNIASGVEVMANFAAVKAVVENLDADNLSAVMQKRLAQPGDMKLSARTTDDGSDWLLCDGRAVSRTVYAALYAAVGTAFGVGDGSTTFNLPDLRGRVPVGRNTANASVDNIGDGDGATLANRSPVHQHSVPAHTHGVGSLGVTTENAHTHTGPSSTAIISDPRGLSSGALGSGGGFSGNTFGWTGPGAAHGHTVTGRAGSGGGPDGDAAMTSGWGNLSFLTVGFLIKT